MITLRFATIEDALLFCEFVFTYYCIGNIIRLIEGR